MPSNCLHRIYDEYKKCFNAKKVLALNEFIFSYKKARKGGVEWMNWKITEFIKPLILNQLKHDDGIAYLFELHDATVS